MSFLYKAIATVVLCLVSTSIASASLSYTAAQEAEQVRHGRHFTTAARKMVVITPNDELTLRIGERLAAHGAVVVDDFISRLFAPRVVVKRVSKIDGHNEAYCVEVRKAKISIYYTSPDMMERAIRQFYFLFDAPYGQRIIRGEDLYYYADEPAAKTNIKRNKSGITDGVSAVLSTSQVESAIRAQLRTNPGSEFTLAIVNRKIFRFDFSALQKINSKVASICVDQPKYTSDQIRRFVAVAREAGGEFTPAIDLLSPNETFENYTGHAMSSVEGMRFVRAIIEQCARQWGIKSICIGRDENCQAPQYYIDFLHEIADREDIKLITL